MVLGVEAASVTRLQGCADAAPSSITHVRHIYIRSCVEATEEAEAADEARLTAEAEVAEAARSAAKPEALKRTSFPDKQALEAELAVEQARAEWDAEAAAEAAAKAEAEAEAAAAAATAAKAEAEAEAEAKAKAKAKAEEGAPTPADKEIAAGGVNVIVTDVVDTLKNLVSKFPSFKDATAGAFIAGTTTAGTAADGAPTPVDKNAAGAKVIVTDVANGRAASGLVVKGDKILSINGTPVTDEVQGTALAKAAVGNVAYSILRAGLRMTVTAYKPEAATLLGVTIKNDTSDDPHTS